MIWIRTSDWSLFKRSDTVERETGPEPTALVGPRRRHAGSPRVQAAAWCGRGMPVDLITTEPAIRLSLFVLVLGLVALAEAGAPRRARALPRRARWPANLGIAALNAVLVRLALPVTAVGMAVIAQERGWGLLHAGSPLPGWAAIALSVVLLDLAIYVQHVLFHAVPILWRLHRMHHADLDIDATTGARFHPVEILLSMGFKLGGIAAIGAPPVGVLVFEVLLSAGSTFSHANLRLPGAVDRTLRRLVVTPDMHRVHHSIIPAETDSNFGFILPWWDHLGGTYRDQPAAGHEHMTLGIEQFRDPRDLRLGRMLAQPLLGRP
jgi:sterol desaturase/sphingolipid hydroxylase (fatty acid hydroxylase superfamily)